ncbi:hypothetical protein B0A55_03192 [Friedmanniomyces simplex]|uniref:Mannan endo-1,6-alpha-mannosidase n=1 Tax=Friedmanniomyces simplex TaxID=329884 RepID=A0A4V5NGN6_9PEZI|nr:hypothetical protein B0A55_03192 [Friedmanniomyces simplex]
MLLLYTTLLGVLALPAAIGAAPSSTGVPSKANYVSHAMHATSILNEKWFDAASGLWDGMWWQSANVLTTIADLASANPNFKDTANGIFENVFTAALATNGGSWLNGFYDDEGWYVDQALTLL